MTAYELIAAWIILALCIAVIVILAREYRKG
jgi:hypothetical protein